MNIRDILKFKYCESLIILLQKMNKSDIDDECKQYIKLLQDSTKIFFSILIILL